MWTIKQIAARDGISTAAVSKRVKKLVETEGLSVERDGRGRVAQVSVASYDHLCGFFGHSEKAQKPTVAQDLPHASGGGLKDSRDEAKRQEAWLDLERKTLAHDEAVGDLVRADKYSEALNSAGRIIQREIGRLPQKADELALAVSKQGEHGARLALKKISTEIGVAIADVLAEIAANAPAHDEKLEGEKV